MNFLAHLWLAERTATSPAGAVLGEFVRGSDLSAYPDEVAEGIRLHRRVDAATDRHPLIRAVRDEFEPGTRRHAGIVIDVACDHVLALQWARLSSESLADFCDRSAATVAAAAAWFRTAGTPPPDHQRFALMLRSYADPAGIEHALARIAARARQPEPLRASSLQWPQAARSLAPVLGRILDDLGREISSARMLPRG